MADLRTGAEPTFNPARQVNLGHLNKFGEELVVPLYGATNTLKGITDGLIEEAGNIESSIAPIEESPAKAAHAVGTYIMYDGELYKVTTAIVIGGTLTPGTNISKVTVTSEFGNTAVQIPSIIVGTYTYNGSAQGPIVAGLDTVHVTITGATNTNAGTYTLTAALNDNVNTAWSDGTTANKTWSYTIAKAPQEITVSKSEVVFSLENLYEDITVTASDAFTVVSSDEEVATVESQGNNVYRISGVYKGTATVTFSIAETANHAGASAIVTADSSALVDSIDNTDWATISSYSQAGTASSMWRVGDAKKVTLNGNVGTLSLSNTDLYVFIIGFDHNSQLEGSGISFQGFKTAKTRGKDICLVNSYGSYKSDGTKIFNLNHWGGSSNPYNTNYGGWKGCDARYDILGSTKDAPSGYGATPTTDRTGVDAASDTATDPVANTLMAALPSDLRAVMKPITKYTDNKGNGSNTAANVTASVDYLPLLSEFEVQGTRSYANQYEKNSQAQYDYYKNGNSKVKYRHNSTGSTVIWWCRSASYYYAYDFCYVNTGGNAGSYSSGLSYGLAPAFLI